MCVRGGKYLCVTPELFWKTLLHLIPVDSLITSHTNPY